MTEALLEKEVLRLLVQFEGHSLRSDAVIDVSHLDVDDLLDIQSIRLEFHILRQNDLFVFAARP